MAELVMDNPFASGLPSHYSKAIQDIRECVEQMQSDFDMNKIPINDDSQHLQRFCAKIEYLLQAGIKPKSSLLGGKKDYWNYISDCVSSNKSLSDGVRFVKAISELKTSLGRGRALLRFALVHQRLADTLQQCLCNSSVTKDWYTPKALWFHQQAASDVISALYDLNDVQFDLDSRGYDLDTAWPTFARNLFKGMAAWQPPSRTISIGSLNSNVQDLSVSVDADRVPQAEQIENDKLASEHKVEELCTENAALKEKVLELQLNANEHLRSTSELEALCMKLVTETEEKEKALAEKEKKYNETLQQAIASDGTASELAARLAVSEKAKRSMQLDLKCMDKEAGAKAKVDIVKNQLIDMQEKKIEKQNVEVRRLQDRVETLLAGKTSDVQQAVDASKKLQVATAELEETRAAYESVVNKNKELTEMLHNVEDKGTAIGKMAKEKLVKYKADNEALQATVDRLEAELTGLRGQGEGESASDNPLQQQVTRLQDENVALVEKFQASETCIAQCREEITSLKTLLDGLKSNNASGIEKMLTQSLLEAKEENIKLGENLDELTQASQKLEKQLEEKTVLWEREKMELMGDMTKKSSELQEMNSRLSEKMGELGAREQEMEGEKAMLLRQLEGQGAEIEQLKQELTGLSKLLEQSGFNELSGDHVSCVKALLQAKSDLEAALMPSHSTQDELLAKLEQAGEKIDSAVTELSTLREEKQELESDKRHQEQMAVKLETSLQQKSKQFDDLSSTFGDLEKQLATLEGRIAQNTDTVKQLNETIVEKDSMIQVKDDKYKSLLMKVKGLQASELEWERTQESLEKQLLERTNELHDLNKKLNEATNRVSSLETINSTLEASNKEREERLDALMKEVEHKETYISEKENDQKQRSESYANLEKQLDAAETYKRLLEEKVNSVSGQLKTKENELVECISVNEEKCKELECKLKDMSDQNSSISQENAKLESRLSELEEIKRNLEDNKQKLTAKIDTLENSCDTNLHKIETLKTKHAETCEKLSKVEAVNAEVVLQCDQLKEEQMSLTSRLDESTKLQHEILSQMDETNKQLSDCQAQLQDREEQLQLLGKEKEALKTDLANLQTTVESLKQQINSIEEEKSSTAENTNRSFFELKEKLGSMQCENDHLRKELQDAVEKKDAMFKSMSESQSERDVRLAELEQSLAEDRQEVEKLQEECQAKAQEIEAFEVTIREKDEQLSKLNKEKNGIETELDSLNKKFESRDEEQLDLTAKSAEKLEGLQVELEQKENELKSERETFQQEMKALQFQLSTQQMQHQASLNEYQDKLSDQSELQEQVVALETRVKELRAQLAEETAQSQEMRKEHAQQVRELNTQISASQETFSVVSEELNKSSVDLEETNEENTSLKEKLEASEKEARRIRKEYEEKVASLVDENEQIKKKLIQLIKEKDALWKRSDRLEYKERMRAQQVWTDGSQVPACTQCGSAFGLLLRRHHCRLCGQIYCYYCCNNWVMTSFSNKKERVCGRCGQDQSGLQSTSEGEDSAVSDHENGDATRTPSRGSVPSRGAGGGESMEDTVEIPSLKSPMWKQRNPDLLVLNPDDLLQDEDESENVQETKGVDEVPVKSEDDTSMTSSQSSAHAHDQTTLLSMTDESKESRLLEEKQTVVGRATKPTLAELAKMAGTGATPSKTDRTQSKDEPYALITPEEVEKSMDTVVPDPYTHMIGVLEPHDFKPSDQSTTDDSKSSRAETESSHTSMTSLGVVTSEPELWIAAGRAYAVPVRITRAGVQLNWSFTTYPKDINFSLVYREDENIGLESGEVLIPMCKCNSHKKAITGQLAARRSGVYTLLFDNKASRFTSKSLNYTLQLARPESEQQTDGIPQ